jgi:hypothetical protein
MAHEKQRELAFDAPPDKPQEFVKPSLRAQWDIEDHLSDSGRNSLEMKTFEHQTRLREAHPSEVNSLKWEIWEHMVWTPGYAFVYANTKKEINSWVSAFTREARSDFMKVHGYKKMLRDRALIKQKELENLPRRMRALQMRAWVASSRRSRT